MEWPKELWPTKVTRPGNNQQKMLTDWLILSKVPSDNGMVGEINFYALKSDGSKDLRRFIKKFTVAVPANNWNHQVAHLNLGSSLRDKQK